MFRTRLVNESLNVSFSSWAAITENKSFGFDRKKPARKTSSSINYFRFFRPLFLAAKSHSGKVGNWNGTIFCSNETFIFADFTTFQSS